MAQDSKFVKLGKYVSSTKGKKPKRISKVKTKECPIPYVNIKAFEKGIIDEYTDGVGCVLCNDGDFLMVWDGSRSGYVGKGIKGALGSTLVKLDFPDIENNYAYYFLQSKFVDINTRAKGVGIPHVDPNILWNYDLLIPPKPTQLAIVSKIEELFSELDKGVEQLKTAQQQLKTYRQAVLKYAFEGKLTEYVRTSVRLRSAPPELSIAAEPEVVYGNSELPEGWKIVLLGQLADMCLGKMLDKQKNKGELMPYLGNINVRWGAFDLDDLKQMRFEADEVERYSLMIGDLIICEGGEPGRCAIWNLKDNSVMIQKALHRVRVNDDVNVKYIYYLIKFKSLNGTLEKHFTGTTIKHLTGRELRKIEVPFTSIDEQNIIVQEIESRLSVADKMEESLTRSLQQAEALRQSILKKAFEGRLI